MRLILPSLFVAILTPQAVAQQQWQQLPGAAQAYAVDVHSLTHEGGVLSARIRTRDVGSRMVVQDVQVRCASSQLRTIDEKLYDTDTGRAVPRTSESKSQDSSAWPEYEAGSEGHAVLSGLCALARNRNVSAPAEHSLVNVSTDG
jgi:hypothetical protein